MCVKSKLLIKASEIVNTVNLFELDKNLIIRDFFYEIFNMSTSCNEVPDEVAKVIAELGYLLIKHEGIDISEKKRIYSISINLLNNIKDNRLLFRNFIKSAPEIYHDAILKKLWEKQMNG